MAAEDTHDLRRQVLRSGRADLEVRFPEDEEPGAFHLAVLDQGRRPVAVVTISPAPTTWRPGVDAWRVRGMAVTPELRGTGLGTQLLGAVVARAQASGVAVLWADGRDTALDFYRRRGWMVEGEGYLAATDMSHHTVVLDL